MEKPSFKSSPWIRGAPHRVFSRDIRRTRWRISLDTGGRPGFLRRDFHVQKSLNPLRCQPMTVSGLTITRAWRQPGHRQDRMTQKTLSAFRSDGRGLFRFRTATCCRRARISVWSAARSAKISMILCMPERVSGGDAKFQGFCDRWNKWEGQPIQELYARINALAKSKGLEAISLKDVHACLKKHDSSYVNFRYFGLGKDARVSKKWEMKSFEIQVLHCLALALLEINLNKMKELDIGFSDTVRKISEADMKDDEKQLLERMKERSTR